MKTVDEIITAVEQRLLTLRKGGGRLPFPITLDWDGEQDNSERVLRLSGSGKCGRQTAYAMHYPGEREELSARALSLFVLGDIIHEKERILIGQVTELGRVEERVHFQVNGEVSIAGHMDGVIEVDGEPMILDIKSINTRGFSEIQKGTMRPDYEAQVNAYMDATGIRKACLWFYNKDTSHRHAVVLEYNPEVVQQVRDRFQRVLDSTPDSLPPREYLPQAEVARGKMTGREYLPWQCSYCPFTERCWSSEGFRLQIDGGKPRWLR